LLKRHGKEPTPPPLFGCIDPENEQADPRTLARSYVVPGLPSAIVEQIANEEGNATRLESRLVQAIWEDKAERVNEAGQWESIRKLEREGEVAKALELAKRIDSPEAAETRSRLAWRSGDWNEIEQLNGGGHQGLLKVLQLRQQGCLEGAGKALAGLNRDTPTYWLERGCLSMTFGHAEHAVDGLRKAVSNARLPHDEARARAYWGLQLARMGRLREGREAIEHAKELLKDGEHVLVIREVLACEAEVDLWTGRWSRAKRTLSALVSQSRSSGDTWILQNSLLGLAELELMTGAENEAVARIEEARRVAEQRKDLEGKLSAKLLDVESLVLKRDWGAVYKKARSLQRRFGRVPFERLRAQWLLRLGRSAIECGGPQKATVYIREARDLNRMLSEPALEARLDCVYAAQLLREKRPQEAVLTFNKAIGMLEGASLPYFLAELYAEFIFLCSGVAPAALVQLRQRSTVRIAKELGAKHLLHTMGLVESDRKTPIAPPGFIAASPRMLGVLEQVERASAFDVPILLQGESGTGKELVALAVHRQSPRVNAPFVPVNCAAIQDSLFETEIFGHVRGAFTGADRTRVGIVEEANGGTLFLDEVADLSPRGQTSLLRVLQDNEYRRVGESKVRKSDFRLIAATHKRLDEEVKAGRFREDLYFRLKVFEIHLPALRERREDILPLAKHFLATKAEELGLPKTSLEEEAEEALLAYTWPGNVRELENEVVHALLQLGSGTNLRRENFSTAIRGGGGRPLRFASQDFEIRYLREVLDRHGGNRTRAARALGLTRQALYKKLRKYGMELTVPQAI
jgi:DNA-binding NtrC family response regulator